MVLAVGVYFTIITSGVQIRLFGDMIKSLLEGTQKSSHHGISGFQAFAVSVASRVGTGNIAGVAMALMMGGPGAIFWMWVVALIGSSAAFAESTLGQLYKRRQGDHYVGGPSYYIAKALKSPWLATLFAILMILTYGISFNMVQANTLGVAFSKILPFGSEYNNKLAMAIFLSLLTALVLLGGATRIAKVSSFLVPIMATFYVIIALIVMVLNIEKIPFILHSIFTEAFNWKTSISGGLAGVMAIGIRRGMFSNEAGLGSAPYAAAAANTSHPVKQGLIQALSVFTDTLIICSATAFIILSADVLNPELGGIAITQAALSQHIGSLGALFIAFALFCFAYSSILGNYYYAESNLHFLNARPSMLTFMRFLVTLSVFVGTLLAVDLVWNMADILTACLATINLAVITWLSPIVVKVLKNYVASRKLGQDPVFKARDVQLDHDLDEWH